MDKAHILREIRRTAQENGGVALGTQRFESETGIKKSDWFGRFWPKWADALREAGLAPNSLTAPIPLDELLEKYATLAMELGRLPANGDLRFKAHQHHEFPAHSTFHQRFGSKAALIRKLLDYCRSRDEYQDVVKMCEEYAPAQNEVRVEELPSDIQVGYVYLVKHGSRREYKIGRTYNPLRREGEVRIELPEKLEPIHVIKTDDPAGVEAYWHRRFASKRKEGEWFALTAQDVRSFKRWKRIY
jgi:Meiotically up-regulated gene 113